MPPEELRRRGREAADWIVDYLDDIRAMDVFPRVEPGEVRAALPERPPDEGEPMDAIFRDFREIVVPGLNHWNHPSFFGYFSITASGPGILGEILAAALNVNAMVWRSAPAATELEDLTTDWLRQLLGLPGSFEGVINDTASSSTLYALAAARRRAYPASHEHGLFGLPPGRVYASDQAHSSVEKAVLTLGLGRGGYRPVASDTDFRMDPDALRRAVAEDRAAGIRPVAVVATLGTTSSASIDPVAEIAEIARGEGLWLHVDAAYGGPAAILPEMRDAFAGWEEADSVVVNPHKWLFTPIDCSVLYCRQPEELARAFSIVPEYLSSRETESARSLMDYGVSLGRRFRSLKLWFVLRYFGRRGIEAALRRHLELARAFVGWVEEEPAWTVVAPVRLATVAFRFFPDRESGGHGSGGGGDRGEDPGTAADAANRRILERVNESGEAFLTHTVLDGRFTLRLSIGNLKTTRDDVERVWALLQGAAAMEMDIQDGA